MRLKIAPQHPQNTIDKDCGSKGAQHRHRLGSHKKSRPEEQKQAGGSSHCQHIAQRTLKNPVGIPVFPERQLLGNHLGDGRRDAVGGNQQNDGVKGVGRVIITLPQVSDDTL